MKYLFTFLMGMLFTLGILVLRIMFSEEFTQRFIEWINKTHSDYDELKKRRTKE